jgi:salicylate hydroxylase
MGDAAHSMVNHMAQGVRPGVSGGGVQADLAQAATSMEDGAFLGVVLAEVVQGRTALGDALDVYETARIPMARMKQQVSFLNGAIWTLNDADGASRDQAMSKEINGTGAVTRSPNLYDGPTTVLEVYGYAVYGHAARMISEWHRGGRFDRAEHQSRAIETEGETGVERWLADRTMNWFLPGRDWRLLREGIGEARTGGRSSRL